MSEVVELAQYKTKAGVDENAFLQAVEEITNWAKAQAGFQFRSVSVDEDGLWTEVMYWASLEDAKSAQAAFMPSNGTSEFMTMIDPSTLKMGHSQLKAKAMAS